MKHIKTYENFYFDLDNVEGGLNFEEIIRDRLIDLDERGYDVDVYPYHRSTISSPAINLSEEIKKLTIDIHKIIRTRNQDEQETRERKVVFESNDVKDDILSIVSELKEHSLVLSKFSLRVNKNVSGRWIINRIDYPDFFIKSIGGKITKSFKKDKLVEELLIDALNNKSVLSIDLMFDRI
jgi:hypothetical protein